MCLSSKFQVAPKCFGIRDLWRYVALKESKGIVRVSAFSKAISIGVS